MAALPSLVRWRARWRPSCPGLRLCHDAKGKALCGTPQVRSLGGFVVPTGMSAPGCLVYSAWVLPEHKVTLTLPLQ